MFRFRFQSLLQLATVRRDVQSAALGEAQARWDHIDEQRQQIAQQRSELALGSRTIRAGVLRLSSLLVQERFAQHLDSEDRRLSAAAEQLQAEVDRCREAVQLANSELRKLELLRDRDHRAWALRQAKADQLLLDERAARSVAQLVKP